MCTLISFLFLTAAQPQTVWQAPQQDEGGHFTEEEYQLSWKWKFVMKWSLEHIGAWFCDVAIRDLDLECDDAWGVNQSFEVLRCGGFHLVITEVVPVGGGADQKVNFISIKMTSE